jgi:predicted transcriptional regulator
MTSAALQLDRDVLAVVDEIAEPLMHSTPSYARDQAVRSMALIAAERLRRPDLWGAIAKECLARLSAT